MKEKIPLKIHRIEEDSIDRTNVIEGGISKKEEK